MDVAYPELSKMIDHALLLPQLTAVQIDSGIDLALAYDVASVCILPYALRHCAKRLRGSSVLPSTVIGFPHGGQAAPIKLTEARQALDDGGEELDMVVNVSRVKSGDFSQVGDEIAAIAELVHGAGRKLKVIFENAYLSNDEKIRLCTICSTIGVDWVKTSTGFAPSGATGDDVRLMRAHCPEAVQVKASGGIRDLDTLLQMRALGASRIGASATADILDEALARLGLPAVQLRKASAPQGY